MSNVNPTCQTGCDVKPPPFSFNDCSPDVNRGQIDRIYIASSGAEAFSDFSSLAEWLARLDNTTDDITKIRFLNVIAEKPVPEANQLDISRKRKIILDKTHTITGGTEETDIVNHDALRQLECDGNIKLWYQAGKYLWGGDEGIDAFINMDDVIPLEISELERIEFTITWEEQFTPEKILNPLPTI